MPLTTGEPTIGEITSTAVPTCQPEATPSAVRAQLRGEAWDSTATIYVCEGAGEAKTLVTGVIEDFPHQTGIAQYRVSR